MSSSDRTARRREIEDATAARLAEIVAAAEEAARQVIDEAEAEARARLLDARAEADRIVAARLAGLAELTDEIAAQAEALRGQSAALQQALAAAKAELGGTESPRGPEPGGRGAPDLDPAPDPEPDRRPPGPALTVVGATAAGEREPEEEPRRERRGGAPPEAGEAALGSNGEPAEAAAPAGARLLATQMAVSGSSRAEIEARLRNGFAITDTGAILDAILGPEK